MKLTELPLPFWIFTGTIGFYTFLEVKAILQSKPLIAHIAIIGGIVIMFGFFNAFIQSHNEIQERGQRFRKYFREKRRCEQYD